MTTTKRERAASMPARRSYAAKRAFDFILAAVGILASLPLWILIAALIILEDGRPVFYTQRRVGKDGRAFVLIKFRSMSRDAEAESGPVLAGEDDPRVTRIGRLLRATALDELPQLVNILLGQMSFVGPRAERPEFVEEYRHSIRGYDERHRVLPGLTGRAQLFGQYDSPPAEKLQEDLEYIRHGSLAEDIRLIALSFLTTFRGAWQKREPKARPVPGGDKPARVKSSVKSWPGQP